MVGNRRRGWNTLLGVSLLLLLLGAAAPAVSQVVADYARNADKVDRRHAVGSRASSTERAGKLVATNRRGHLPNNIIRKAIDARALGGVKAARYATRCGGGSLGGVVAVDSTSNLSSEWTALASGYIFVHWIGGPPPGVDRCDPEGLEARRVGTGIYEIRTSGQPLPCFTQHLPAVATAHSRLPVIATQETVCEEGVVIRVSLWNQAGDPVDTAFDVAILEPVVVGLP
ncbi:MAG: hypothetical protein M3N53_06575 [Actinomycetota bacterium]|nr:hypothetical protein [Actinomycetota bacterium]